MILGLGGIRRSGNHAITMWIINHFNSTKFYSDFTYPHNRRATPNFGKASFHKHEIYVKVDEMILQLSRPDHLDIHNDNVRFKYENTIYGLENYYPDEISNFKNFGIRFDKKILVIRDPINNLASIIKNKAPLINLKHYSDIWKSHASVLLNKDNEFLIIIYDKWFSDYEYRRTIEKELGLEINDKGLNRVHHAGGGSSFEHLSKQDDAQKMKVLERWMHCKTNYNYLKILNDKKLLEMRKEIFGSLPDILAKRFKKMSFSTL